VSALTVVVMVLIVIFDLRSATDAIHARIPWIYLGYIGAGLGWFWVRRGKMKDKGLGIRDLIGARGSIREAIAQARCPRGGFEVSRLCRDESSARMGHPD
jgi:hypothetical protein